MQPHSENTETLALIALANGSDDASTRILNTVQRFLATAAEHSFALSESHFIPSRIRCYFTASSPEATPPLGARPPQNLAC